MQSSKIKVLEITSRILILVSILFIYIFSDYTSFLKHNYFCYGIKLTNPLLPYIILVLAIFFEIIANWLRRKNNLPKKKSFFSFSRFLILWFIVFLFLAVLLVSMCACGSSGSAIDTARKADLRQIQTAQKMFYEKNYRYATSQKELVEAGIFPVVIIDPVTKKEYTDADGFGLDGGDDNPNTWEAQTILSDYNLEICRKENKELIFYHCNENGCGPLNEE